MAASNASTRFTLGIDVACRAPHQAALVDQGRTLWKGRRFTTCVEDLERLWAGLGLEDPAELTVVLEPTRNVWIVLAQWFRRRGARVVMVPTTQSADLRDYLSKHTKNDRIDSEVLARLPLFHPEGLRPYTGDGPADPLRRLVKQRSAMVKSRTAVYARLDAKIELLGPGWHAVLGSDFSLVALQFLARYANPHAVVRLGRARLAQFLASRSRGRWGRDHATALIAAAEQTLALWEPVEGGGEDVGGIDFIELAEDIAQLAEQALFLGKEIKAAEDRIARLYARADPDGIIASAPGVGPVASSVIAGRLGEARRFTSLAAVRSYAGLVPKTTQSGVGSYQLKITKAGDPLLREALFAAAEHARRADPQLAAKYQRLTAGNRHHNSAICHLAAVLLTRIAACMRNGEHYVLRDIDGTPITPAEGRAIIKQRYTPTDTSAAGRESQKSQSAPTSQPANTHPTSRIVA